MIEIFLKSGSPIRMAVSHATKEEREEMVARVKYLSQIVGNEINQRMKKEEKNNG